MFLEATWGFFQNWAGTGPLMSEKVEPEQLRRRQYPVPLSRGAGRRSAVLHSTATWRRVDAAELGQRRAAVDAHVPLGPAHQQQRHAHVDCARRQPPSLHLPAIPEHQPHAGLHGQHDEAGRLAHDQGRVLPEPQPQGADARRAGLVQLLGHGRFRPGHGEPARHRLRLCQRGDGRLLVLRAAVEDARGQLHL